MYSRLVSLINNTNSLFNTIQASKEDIYSRMHAKCKFFERIKRLGNVYRTTEVQNGCGHHWEPLKLGQGLEKIEPYNFPIV